MWGPILFSLYCADLAQHVTEAEVVAYADDITLVASDRDPQLCRARMDRALAQLGEYCRRNRIAPNSSRSAARRNCGSCAQ